MTNLEQAALGLRALYEFTIPDDDDFDDLVVRFDAVEVAGAAYTIALTFAKLV